MNSSSRILFVVFLIALAPKCHDQIVLQALTLGGDTWDVLGPRRHLKAMTLSPGSCARPSTMWLCALQLIFRPILPLN